MKRVVLIAALLLCWVLPASAVAAGDPGRRVVVEGPVLVDRGQTTSDVYVADGDVTVRGTVDGDLVVADGDVTVRGRVTGDVVTLAGTAILGRRAQVDGDVRYADKKPQVAPGANVGGDVKKLKFDDAATAVKIGVWVAVTVSTLVLGLVLLLLFPRAADAVARTSRSRTGMVALTGVLAFILIPLIGVAVLFTVVGIPLGIGLLLAWLPLYGLAYTAGAFLVGRLVVRSGSRILAFVAGLAILRVLAIVPFLGELAWAVATIFGLGALLTAALRARKA
jgi:cytoskeletal protein CcmA (bactofilin family)